MPELRQLPAARDLCLLRGDEKAGAEAEAALAEAPDSTSKNQAKAQVKQAQAQGAAIQKAIKQSAPEQGQLENPLGGLGGTQAPLPSGG